jgi:hypothetical protein
VTLRVELSIVPFGDEDSKRVIHQINISNLGLSSTYPDQYEYGVEVDCYKTGDYNHKVFHRRDAGAIELVRKAIGELR